MAKVVTDDKHYCAIADAIRENLPDSYYLKGVGFTPSEMPSAIGEVRVMGEDTGYWYGYGNGEQAEYDRMWDMLQQNGTRQTYPYAFIDWGWEYIRPKYKIVPITDQIAYLFGYNVNLIKAERQYVDLSQRTSASDTASNSGNFCVFMGCTALEEVEDIGMIAGYYYKTFRNCPKLHSIAMVQFNSTTLINQAFDNCDSLVNLSVRGTIGQNGLDLRWSAKLSKSSITSVVNALSPSTGGLAVTFSRTAVDNAFSAQEWATLAATKSNWTINLV